MKLLFKLFSLVTVLSISISGLLHAEIEISFRFNDAGQKEMRAAIDEFEKKNPGIKVDLQRIAWLQLCLVKALKLVGELLVILVSQLFPLSILLLIG